MRLLKEFSAYNAATDTATLQPGGTLWNQAGADLLSGACDSALAHNLASWSDCSPNGYSLRFLSPPANTMTMQIGTS